MTKPLSTAFLLDLIFKYNNPLGAIEAIKEYYGEDKKDKAYQRWGSVRQSIRCEEEYRSNDFHAEIGSLMEKGGLPFEIETFCQDILSTDILHEQFKIFNKTLFRKWRKENSIDIKIMHDNYYLFEMGDPVYQEIYKAKTEKRVDDRFHHRGSITFEFDEIKLREIRRRVSNYLDSIESINTTADCQRAVAALRFVTGRRPADLVFQCTFSPGANPYQAFVDKLAKQGNVHIMIPLLHRYETVEKVHQMVKDFASLVKAKPPFAVVTTIPTYVSRRMYGVRIAHTEIRSIYAELAFRERKIINRVHPDIEVAVEYHRRIFAHNTLNDSIRYSLIKIN